MKGEKDWGTWSIKTESKIGTYSFPTNGIMFFESDIWVEGQINTARLTIGAGLFPEQKNSLKNIIVNNNLRYTNYDGSDVIGLIAQDNFWIGAVSADNLPGKTQPEAQTSTG